MNRWWILVPALGAAVLLNWWGGAPDPQAAVVPAALPRRAAELRSTPGAPAASAALHGLIARDKLYTEERGRAGERDLFEGRQWTPPPVAVAASAPAVDPTPPFPYAYAGRKQDGDAVEVYLTRGEFAYLVKPGEMLEESYRVVAVTPTQLTVLYVPTNFTHTIQIGDAD